MSQQHATEIAYLPLKEGANLDTGEQAEAWQKAMKIVTSQPGCLTLYWGIQIEDPTILQLALEWETLDSHKDFMKSPIYTPFLEIFDSFLSDKARLFHVVFPSSTPLAEPLSAPVVECISLYFSPSHPSSEYDANFARFREDGLRTAQEAQGIVGGWGVEPQWHEKLGDGEEGGEGKFFAVFIGWPSVDAHMEYRKTEVFPDVVKYLRDGPKAVKVHHVSFKKY